MRRPGGVALESDDAAARMDALLAQLRYGR